MMDKPHKDKPEAGDEVIIRSVTENDEAEGGHTYEIDPVKYSGPWKLPRGTVLQVTGRVGEE